MQYQENHTMVLAVEYSDGSQIWTCPTCGRRMLMSWPPDHSRSILEEGDPNVIHSGEVNGNGMEAADDAMPVELDDPYLAPFKDWIENYYDL